MLYLAKNKTIFSESISIISCKSFHAYHSLVVPLSILLSVRGMGTSHYRKKRPTFSRSSRDSKRNRNDMEYKPGYYEIPFVFHNPITLLNACLRIINILPLFYLLTNGDCDGKDGRVR